jgi:hypothetical protein
VDSNTFFVFSCLAVMLFVLNNDKLMFTVSLFLFGVWELCSACQIVFGVSNFIWCVKLCSVCQIRRVGNLLSVVVFSCV